MVKFSLNFLKPHLYNSVNILLIRSNANFIFPPEYSSKYSFSRLQSSLHVFFNFFSLILVGSSFSLIIISIFTFLDSPHAEGPPFSAQKYPYSNQPYALVSTISSFSVGTFSLGSDVKVVSLLSIV